MNINEFDDHVEKRVRGRARIDSRQMREAEEAILCCVRAAADFFQS
jgi:hypothetical protein